MESSDNINITTDVPSSSSSSADYDIKIVPNLLEELTASMQVNESTPAPLIQSIHTLQEEITKATQTIGSEHPQVLQLLRDLVEKYIEINHFSHAERLLRRLEKAYIRTYGTSHIQYIYQSIRLGDVLQWQIRYDEAKEMYIRALQLYLKFYDIVAIEDFIGHEFVSPAIASERFLKSIQGQMRVQRRHKKLRKRETLKQQYHGRGILESEAKRDDDEMIREVDEELKVSYDADSKESSEWNREREREKDKGYEDKLYKSDENEEDEYEDEDGEYEDEDKVEEDKDHISDVKQSDQVPTNASAHNGHGMEDDNASIQSSIISIVSSTDGRAHNVHEKYTILERLLSGTALVYYQMRLLDYSERYYKQLLTLYYDILFPYHPYHLTILNTINYLSLVMEAMNRVDEAEIICQQSYQDCELYYGPTHDLTLTAISTLARLLYAMKKVAKSEETYLTAIERSLQVNGSKHSMTLELRTSLSILYKETGRYYEAIDIVEKILLPQSEEFFGKYDIHTLIIYDQIGELYSKLRGITTLPQSLAFYQQAYSGKCIYYHTNHHPDVYTSQFLLGQIYHRMCSWKHQLSYQEIKQCTYITLSNVYHGLMKLFPVLSYHSLALEISLYYGQFLLQFNYFQEVEPVYLKLFEFYDSRLGMEKYILKPRNEHKRGSTEFLSRNSMIVSAASGSGKADIVGLTSKPSSPDIFASKSRSRLVTPNKSSRGASAGGNRGDLGDIGGEGWGTSEDMALRLNTADLDVSQNDMNHHGGDDMNMFFSTFSPFASKQMMTASNTFPSVPLTAADAGNTSYWMSTMSGLNAHTTHSASFSVSPRNNNNQKPFLPAIAHSPQHQPQQRFQSSLSPHLASLSITTPFIDRPPTRTQLPALMDKTSLKEMRSSIESRGKGQLDEINITTNRIIDITTASRAMSSTGRSRGGGGSMVSGGSMTRANSTSVLDGLHGISGGGAGKVKGHHLGVSQGLTLNVRNLPIVPKQNNNSGGTARMSSPVKITTTRDASYNAINAPTSPQTVELDYSHHPITNVEIAKKTKNQVHQTYTIPELLIYADACYQLALLAERKVDYKKGYTYFTYAYILYSILLDHPRYSKEKDKEQEFARSKIEEEKKRHDREEGKNEEEESLEEMETDSTRAEVIKKVLTVSDGHRPDRNEVEKATRSVISKMTTDETDSVFGGRNSGMMTVPKVEDYDRQRLLSLKSDALEQVHHSEYLHLVCNNA